MPVAVVTDSTAYLPSDLAAAHAITVVPLVVVINGVQGREGIDVAPSDVVRALTGRRVDVMTSRPSPAEFTAAYDDLLARGSDGIVSIHLSKKLSGTCDAAIAAAAEVDGAVSVVDSQLTGMGLGFVALAAARVAAGGAVAADVVRAAEQAVERTTVLFYVDTLEFLRRGGRIGAASALLGTALSVKPILHMTDGAIVPREKVRTSSRALARLVDLAIEAADGSDVDVAVHHMAAPERASALVEALTARLGDRMRDPLVVEIGAAVAAHVGPGFAGVAVHRRSPTPT